MKDGFLRVCAAVPNCAVGDCDHNRKEILHHCQQAAEEQVQMVVFPQLSITGASCGDLFWDATLLQSAKDALASLQKETSALDLLLVVGLPLAKAGAVYNAAAVLYRGQVLGYAAKETLTRQEHRWFTPCPREGVASQQGTITPLFVVEVNGRFQCGVILEDDMTACGAVPPILLCPCGEEETVDSQKIRAITYQSQSRQLISAVVGAYPGAGESTTDGVYGGARILAENGVILAEGELFTTGRLTREIDYALLLHHRRQQQVQGELVCHSAIAMEEQLLTLTRSISPTPFLPEQEAKDRKARIHRVFALQCEGLKKRLTWTHCKTLVLGLSGGLDSTHALLVAVETYRQLGWNPKDILAVSMPCFGTTARTKSNAETLAEVLGVSYREISIEQAVLQHFADIHHSKENQDVTFENAQARERTQVLMDLANQKGGMVLGTGDLSELALGWATYNGDHMSMYGINAGVPKTFLQSMVAELAKEGNAALQNVLEDILSTPVSPELLPAKAGEITQKTEDLVGPYRLHDFFLYHVLLCGDSPKKLLRLAKHAFAQEYTEEILLYWLQNFYRRFFSQQFKRSCLPDGPNVLGISLSPRMGFQFPSDASAKQWIQELS